MQLMLDYVGKPQSYVYTNVIFTEFHYNEALYDIYKSWDNFLSLWKAISRNKCPR